MSLGFEIVCKEIIAKKVPADQVFAYAALRFRQMEEEMAKLVPQNAVAEPVKPTDHK